MEIMIYCTICDVSHDPQVGCVENAYKCRRETLTYKQRLLMGIAIHKKCQRASLGVFGCTAGC